MLKQLVRTLFSSGKRSWTVEEVRGLIDAGDFAGAQEAADQLHAATPRRDLTRDCILAEIAFRQMRDADAEDGFRAVLKQAPGFADAHYGLSLLLLEQGETEAAIEHAQFAKNVTANDARYLAQLGCCQVTVGNYPNAELPLTQALRLNDKDKASWNNLGLVYLAKEQPGDAHACFAKALKLDPTFALALQNLAYLEGEMRAVGAVFTPAVSTLEPAGELVAEERAPWRQLWDEVDSLKKAGQPDKALARAEAICMEWPDSPEPVCELDALYRKLGDAGSGMDVLQAYLVAHPDEGQILAAMGASLLAANDNAQAERYLNRALENGFKNVKVLGDLAQCMSNLEKHAEALEVRREVFALEPSFLHQAHLAATLSTACYYAEAIAQFDDLIEREPEKKSVFLVSYAVAQAYSGHFDKALALLNEALAIQPRDANLHLQRAQINLLRGNFAEGWAGYAYRGLAYTRQYRVLPFRKWRGQDIAGKCIVVLAEQGLGDQVMLASCLPDLLALGPARVVVEVIGRVAPTLARSFPQCEIVHTKQDKKMEWAKTIGDVDYFVPLGDLPQYFRTSVEAFPGKAYLKADPERVAYWRQKLEATGPRPWIGVSWRGGLQATRRVLRSMSPGELAPMTSAVAATWISLQYGSVDEDLKTAAAAGVMLTHWNEAIADLDEFAALIESLDAVVTVCNTTVHYAGALGKKVLVLAPHIPEWRYGLNSTHMPWYPDARVLRQPSPNDWPGVVAEATDALKDIFG
ncbi:MAG: tetratricopeptide repeat protein [Polaromonas sp.]|uniref:tetratricopeptide repeat protein n=1 Tax=Polaromonas sp. TaxID=1869339 RepID=UPI0040359CE2